MIVRHDMHQITKFKLCICMTINMYGILPPDIIAKCILYLLNHKLQ